MNLDWMQEKCEVKVGEIVLLGLGLVFGCAALVLVLITLVYAYVNGGVLITVTWEFYSEFILFLIGTIIAVFAFVYSFRILLRN